MDDDLDRYEGELAAVEGALLRLEEGSYGTCAACGAAISDEELAAEPTARYHAAHRPS
jgi:RNA polymerase-binding transcription factor DksA